MRRRHPEAPRSKHLPRTWLMTDERMGDRLWRALDALPKGSGVIFRHYSLPSHERRALFAQVARIAKRRRLLLLRAGREPLGRGADGVHNGHRRDGSLLSRSVHSQRELVAAIAARADLIFVSPVFATASHPNARTLGPVRAARLASLAPMPVIALGGMTPHRFKALRSAGFHGWAAIGWWTGN